MWIVVGLVLWLMVAFLGGHCLGRFASSGEGGGR